MAFFSFAFTIALEEIRIWRLKDEIFHNILNLLPNESAGDGSERNLRRIMINGLNFGSVLWERTLNDGLKNEKGAYIDY